jgi:hypothetical protein
VGVGARGRGPTWRLVPPQAGSASPSRATSMNGASAADPRDGLPARALWPQLGSPPNYRGLIVGHEFHGKSRVAHGALARHNRRVRPCRRQREHIWRTTLGTHHVRRPQERLLTVTATRRGINFLSVQVGSGPSVPGSPELRPDFIVEIRVQLRDPSVPVSRRPAQRECVNERP